MPKNPTTKERLSIVETKVCNIKDVMDKIVDNHLPTIEKKIDDLGKDLYKRPTWLISGVITLLIALIVFLLTKSL